MDICFRFTHPPNPAISVHPSGIAMDSSEVHPRKALPVIFFTGFLNVTLFRFSHPQKVWLPISSTLSSSISTNFLQLLKFARRLFIEPFVIFIGQDATTLLRLGILERSMTSIFALREKVSVSRLLQSSKGVEYFQLSLIFPLITTSLNPAHPSNAPLPISVSPSITTFFKLLQPLKALQPSSKIVRGIVTSSRFRQFSKQFHGILRRDRGN